MLDTITVTGSVATAPRHVHTNEELEITSFRLASSQRRYDRKQGKWIDAETNWYTVTCFRQLAANAAASLQKGERVVVRGRLRIRDWTSGDRSGTTIEIEADAVGHDLTWGTSSYTRTLASQAAPTTAPSGEEGADEAGDTVELDGRAEALAATPF